MTSAHPYQTPLRVLVVDDTEHWRVSLQSLFEEGEIFCTGEAFELTLTSSYEEARAALIQRYFDLAIVDLVLHPLPPGEVESWEGFWLLQDLYDLGLQTETAVIVLTSFGSGSVATIALREFAALTFLDKDQALPEIGHRIQQQLVDHTHFGMRCVLTFADGHDWSTLLESLSTSQLRRLTSPISTREAIDELDHLLRRVEQSATQLHLTPLRPGFSGAVVARLARTRSDGVIADTIIKLGTADQIRSEEAAHRAIVEFIQGHKATQIKGHAVGRHMGVLEYTLVGANEEEVIPFRRFYQDAAATAVQQCLDSLFGGTCRRWYIEDNAEPSAATSLETQYLSELGTSREAIWQAYVFKFGPRTPSGGALRLVELPRLLPDPVDRLSQGALDHSYDTVLTLRHGDLHGDNILVDGNTSDGWLIDFATAGRGHWARDFTTLECCIKFQYVMAADLSRLFELEDSLATRGWSVGPDESERWLDRPDIAKAMVTIGTIRTLAATAVEGLMPRDQLRAEYTAGLLFTTLNYLRFHSQLKRKTRKNQVLMAAARLVEELDAV